MTICRVSARPCRPTPVMFTANAVSDITGSAAGAEDGAAATSYPQGDEHRSAKGQPVSNW